MDEVRASSGAESEVVPLLHPWKRSSERLATPFHAKEQRGRGERRVLLPPARSTRAGSSGSVALRDKRCWCPAMLAARVCSADFANVSHKDRTRDLESP